MTRSAVSPLAWALWAAVVLVAGTAVANPPPGRPASVHPAPAPVAPGSSAAPEGVVNVNVAAEDELVRLPGIGPARARAIVQLRERVHQFGHAEDLLRVRGIGRVGFRRLRPFVTLTGPTTLTARPGARPGRTAPPDAAPESAPEPDAPPSH